MNYFANYEKTTTAEEMSAGAIAALIIIGILLLIFWIWMFLDAIKNKKLDDTRRLIWSIGMIVMPPLAILYFFAGRKK